MTLAILMMICGALGLIVGDHTGSELITICALVHMGAGFVGVVALRLIDRSSSLKGD